MASTELVSIGKIVGVYGYKGLVKVVPLTDFPERFNHLKTVYITKGQAAARVPVEVAKPYREYYLFGFPGIDSKEKAAEYRGALLQVDESEVYPLPEGYFYHFQLKGLSVYDCEKGFLGEVKDILETGANDVYVINSSLYGEILIPAIKDVIKEIDLSSKTMQVKLLPGLLVDKD